MTLSFIHRCNVIAFVWKIWISLSSVYGLVGMFGQGLACSSEFRTTQSIFGVADFCWCQVLHPDCESGIMIADCIFGGLGAITLRVCGSGPVFAKKELGARGSIHIHIRNIAFI